MHCSGTTEPTQPCMRHLVGICTELCDTVTLCCVVLSWGTSITQKSSVIFLFKTPVTRITQLNPIFVFIDSFKIVELDETDTNLSCLSNIRVQPAAT